MFTVKQNKDLENVTSQRPCVPTGVVGCDKATGLMRSAEPPIIIGARTRGSEVALWCHRRSVSKVRIKVFIR